MTGPHVVYAIGAALAAFGVVGLIASDGKSRLGFPVVVAACGLLVLGLAWGFAASVPGGWLVVAAVVLLLGGYAWLARRGA